MDDLGFISLGASAGFITSIFLAKVKTPMGMASMLGALSPVVFTGGAAFLLIESTGSKGVALYPLGLLLSLLWGAGETVGTVLDKCGLPRWSRIAFGVFMFVLSLWVIIKLLSI